jgi:chromatin remodeling complex protein RSC6
MSNLVQQNNVFEQFESIIESLNMFKTQISSVQNKIKILEKNVKKQMSSLQKAVSKGKIKGNKKPSGFAKPTKVTNELCEFMNKEIGSEIARTDVTRALITYIELNNLQNETNKKIISPDDKLKGLLGLEENEELTYFNLQKYMNKHFIKTPSSNISKTA